MSRYRRTTAVGSSYFLRCSLTGGSLFYVVKRFATHCAPRLKRCIWRHPLVIDAWVLLPDHLHCVWTLPEGDADFSTRWMIIKRSASLVCRKDYRRADWVTASKLKHRESTIWQRQFWEHQIRDENDFASHVDYIHFNLVKYGHVQHAIVRRWKTCPPYGGYLLGLKGDAIPLEVRTVAVADTFDALISCRSYKDAWSNGSNEASGILLAEAKLDVACVNIMIENRTDVEQIQSQSAENTLG